MRVLVLHGPNLNLLGTREPEVYGAETLDELDRRLATLGGDLGVVIETFQSNGEGALVDRIHRAAGEGIAGVVINPGGYTHTSVALRDALLGTGLPFVEIHLSNPYAREAFRHQSLLRDVAAGVVLGLGPVGYELALRGLISRLCAAPKRAPTAERTGS
ncbi:MAG: type II 3-dehydroquinate dehydratase [Deltaproteobacteria bacterium]|nr:type II 3-dehydroquinate dehydratase [Deltaproteobacteria bacterium]